MTRLERSDDRSGRRPVRWDAHTLDISRLGAGTRPPVFIKEGLKFTDLLFEFVEVLPFQLDLMPNQPGRDGCDFTVSQGASE